MGTFDNTYYQSKTPYFKIQVQSPDGKKGIDLPHHIMRLIKSVKIIETINQDKRGKSDFNSVELVFVEGSREPASANSSKSNNGLYPMNSGKSSSMSLTNKVGTITDLRFSGFSAIKTADPQEVKDGTARSNTVTTVQGCKKSKTHKEEKAVDKTPKFLIAAYNIVKLTWGYVEDPDSKRTIKFRIKALTTKFTDSQGTITTVIGFDGGDDAEGLTPPKAPKLPEPENGGVIEDLDVQEYLINLCNRIGLRLISSNNLIIPIMKKDYRKSWAAGESLDDFIAKLAKRHGCVYKFVLDPRDKSKDVLYFVNEEDFFAKSLKRQEIKGRDVFIYKSPGSIIKSIDAQLAFNNLTDIKRTAINDQGKECSDSTQKQDEQMMKPNKEAKEIINKKRNVPWVRTALDDLFDFDIPERVDYVNYDPDDAPENQNKKNQVDKSSLADDFASLNFTTIGFTRLSPGLIKFSNLGERYNGYYKVKTVEHVIDSSGYTCKGFATSALGEDGEETDEGNKINGETEISKKLDELLFGAN